MKKMLSTIIAVLIINIPISISAETSNDTSLVAGVTYSIIQSIQDIEYIQDNEINIVTSSDSSIMYTNTNVNVRMAPSINSDIYITLDTNSEVIVIDNTNEWVICLINNNIYYIYNEYLSKEMKTYDLYEKEMLAHLIFAEVGSDWISDTCLYYAGSVVLNRIESKAFPNTMIEVINQRGQYACKDYYMKQQPTKRCYDIAEDLLINGSVLPKNVVFQSGFKQGNGIYAIVDGVFYCYR